MGRPAPRHARRHLAGPGVHLLSRLRTRLVLQEPLGQRPRGLHLRRPDIHALLPLALAARHPPRNLRPSRQTRRRRCLDDDSAGVPGLVTLETFFLSVRSQSVRAVRHRATLCVPVPPALCLAHGQSARTSFGLVDELRARRRADRHELDIRFRYVSAAANRGMDGGRRHGHLALLHSASVRRRLLGTGRSVGLHRGRIAGKLVLQASEAAAVALRQHRLPPHPPSEPAHP